MITDLPWTCAEDIEASVLALWSKGRILAAKVTGEPIFPLRIPMRGPDSSALVSRFGDAQTWIRDLETASRTGRGFGFDVIWREMRHRQLGHNRIPLEIVVPTEADALQLIRKETEAKLFQALAHATALALPELMPWLARRPLVALDHAADWARVLDILSWFRENPQSGLYLRQVNIPQVDTKFIEGRKGLITEMLIAVLPPASSEPVPGKAFTFEERYGLRNKPATVRFRLLDGQSWFAGLSDIRTPAKEFARLNLTPRVVFITENEVNGLAFPPVDGAMVLFGLGYSLALLAEAEWLRRSCLVYWGDIDTHGFTMLARLRTYFLTVQSMLMDETTLLAHQSLWVREEQPFVGDLLRLSEAERQLFENLKFNRYGDHIRLEQERIPYDYLTTVLQGLDL